MTCRLVNDRPLVEQHIGTPCFAMAKKGQAWRCTPMVRSTVLCFGDPYVHHRDSGGCFIWARVKRRYERLQLRSAITTQNMWFTVCSDRGPYVAIPLFRLCLWLKLPVGRMTFQSFDVRVRHWSSRSGLVFLGSCKMACRQVYMR